MADTTTPTISVILPAYNCDRYIAAAVQSILDQTFTDFELIIIDDGSVDQTAAVIRGFDDPRIRFIQNETNTGLVSTLNKGVQLSTGKLIARMDGDDISASERFERQVYYLEEHPEIGLVTSTAELMDEEDKPMDPWKDDVEHVTPGSIRAFLPYNNCIVHPAVLGRKEHFLALPYSAAQAQAEDYDLWLRMSARGIGIGKIITPLVRHRILRQSFTRKRQRNVFWKNASTKLKFAGNQLATGRLSGFMLKTTVSGLADVVKGFGKKIKQSF